MAEQREDDRRLPRARLADQAQHLAGLDGEGNVADHVGAGPAEPDLEPVDVQPDLVLWPPERRIGAKVFLAGHHACSGPRSSRSAASSGRRSTPIVTLATASVNVLVPMVSKAISTAGAITAHGLSCRPIRFSLIIVPQLAAGGGWPKPRKARPAMITIE